MSWYVMCHAFKTTDSKRIFHDIHPCLAFKCQAGAGEVRTLPPLKGDPAHWHLSSVSWRLPHQQLLMTTNISSSKDMKICQGFMNQIYEGFRPPARSCFLTLTLLSLRFSWKVKHCAMKLMCSSHSVGKTMNEMKTDETSWQQSWLSSQNSISIIVMTMSTIIIINTILLFISSSQATGLATSSAECEIILI